MPRQGKRRGDMASEEATPARGEPYDESIAIEAREDMPDSRSVSSRGFGFVPRGQICIGSAASRTFIEAVHERNRRRRTPLMSSSFRTC